MRKNLHWIALGALGGAVLVVLYSFLFPPDSTHYSNYQRIQEGMTLEEVQTILGPGTEIDLNEVPGIVVAENPAEELAFLQKARREGTTPTSRSYPTRVKPVVEGDRVFRWIDEKTQERILVAFRNGKVCEKRFWDLNYF